MRLLPREEKFFGFFQDQVEIISEAAALLLDGVRNGNSKLAENARRIEELERKGDEIIHHVFTLLNKTFITPLDPEDIHSLSSRLDDVLDGIEDAAHRMVAYRLHSITPETVHLTELVNGCCKALQSAFTALNASQPLLEHCIEINRLEDEADGVERRAVAELFEKTQNPLELIKLKEVYELLELTTDRCEDVADVLQGVVVKNS